MNRAVDLFAGPRLTGKQDGGLSRGDLRRLSEHPAPCDDSPTTRACAPLPSSCERLRTRASSSRPRARPSAASRAAVASCWWDTATARWSTMRRASGRWPRS